MSEKNNSIEQRLHNLKELLLEQGLDALLISHDDEYLSYELNPDQERLKYITGFSGSAGFAVITSHLPEITPDKELTVGDNDYDDVYPVEKNQAIFVDGRYVVQVKEQIDDRIFQDFNISRVSPSNWICSVLPRNSKVGIDLNCISYKSYLKIKDELQIFGIQLIDTSSNLVDKIWLDKPEPVISKVEIFPDEYNGSPSRQKRQKLAQSLRDQDLDATIICDPESICWLLNIRGRDRKYLPIINCRMVAYSNEALEWYIDPKHLDDNLQEQFQSHFGHIDIFPENRFDDVIDRLCNSSCTIFVDPDTTNAHIMKKLKEGGADLVEGLGLCQLPKACKNHLEVAGEYKAHIKDGIAMCRFLSWLDEHTKLPLDLASCDEEAYLRRVDKIDEEVLANRAESFRKVESGYIEPSFATISALGANAAMCHYNHQEVSTLTSLGKASVYLIDSGAHYIEGTTDITRTHLVGPWITEELKKMYTLVLKAHIALATIIFPRGTSGLQIDAIARRPLWNYGFDFAHGTGHGVGHVLSVHEGPQAISSRHSSVPLMPGMVISNEPGFYKEGEYGIRLENLMVVMECSQPGMQHMLCFSPLTLVPFDTRLIKKELLDQSEIDWLNNYHQNVHNVILNAATTLSDTESSWLKQACTSI